MKVFISHTFADDDQELALKLQKILAEENIEGYLAEKKKEYDLLIRDKIRKEIEKSDHMVAIVTNKARESASVNQEIGYALREGIKPVIMLEENAKAGVLTHGIEPEEFTRNNFVVHCKRVRDFILQKGDREKETEKSSVLINEIYRRLYNELLKLNDKALINDQLDDPWNAIDPYSKLKTDSMISEEFEKLSKEIKVWNDMSRAKAIELQYKQKAIGDIIATCFQKSDLLNNHGDIILSEHSSMSPSNWVQALRDVLLYDPTITSGQDLYDKLYAYAILRDDEHHIFLKRFRQLAPLLFECIFLHLTEARNVLSGEPTDKDVFNQNNILKAKVQKIKEKLEEKLK